MLYLSINFRPDIAYAVNQAARFSNYPKCCHKVGIKRIARYLEGTLDKRMIVKPSSSMRLDLFVDTDFLELFCSEYKDDAFSIKSRTKCVAAGVPVCNLVK